MKAFIGQRPELPATELFGDLAYTTPAIISHLEGEQTRLMAPKKKPKGKAPSEAETYYNRLVRRIRQPIESLFVCSTGSRRRHRIQRASKMRSTDAQLIHCLGKLAVAFFLLVLNY